MPRRSSARAETIPVPTMGINTKDNISQMDPLYALEAENYFSNGAAVELRKGYRQHVKAVGSGGSGHVIGLYELITAGGTQKLVAVGVDDHAYDVTTAGNAPDADLSTAGVLQPDQVAGYSSGCMYRNLLWIADWAIRGIHYWNGATAKLTQPGFTGVLTTALTAPQPYKNRLYLIQDGTAAIWYTAVDAITGALTTFDVQSVLSKGGKLIFVGGLTQTGDSQQELFCMISNMGEVLVYQGTYPGSTTWSLVGRYHMPPPVGPRAFFYWGPNLCVITYQGVILMSEVMRGGSNLTFLTDKISDQFVGAFSEAVFGGQVASGLYYPNGNCLIINIPSGAGLGVPVQFVMNTTTGSWWKWTGINAYAWATFGGNLYFGGDNYKVYRADNGYFDEDPLSEGNAKARTCTLRPAYNYLGDRSGVKQFTAIRPIISESEGLSITVNADVDYADTTATLSYSDTTDTNYKLYQPTIGIQAIGRAASIRFDDSVTTKRRTIHAIEVFWNEGDIT